ncbi:FG-GAP repeat domain-containing protein [Streptomyces cellostaticus]|uniref:FG-GAP repeat domain-containing protein n=1 Tax=Streptomyces cellostaticus TaxID=67285 RepID=UPI00202651DB|nr:VCBS repeat-containing protein [Streptomyces cellostaticus]
MRVRRRGTSTAATAVLCGTLLLAACGPGGAGGAQGSPPARTADAPARLPVPRGAGSDVPDDFNGDGHRDLVLNDLVKKDSHADDAGIGIVYGGPHGLAPGARQLLTPKRRAAPTEGRLPAVFDAEEGCDLDGDGFTDLIVSTDPPYDGQGRPPVPLQVLFGSPAGLTGRAVRLTVPDRARFGNDWPDQPVCGDFDGDGSEDLVLHASGGRLSYLRGPFGRNGAPRAAGAPLASPGEVPAGPAADVDGDGSDDLVVRAAQGAGPASLVLGGPAGPVRTGTRLPAGVDVALGRFGRGTALDAAVGGAAETSLRYDLPTPAARAALTVPGTMLDAADFDGDGRDELVSSGSRLRVLRAGPAGLSGTGAVTLAPPAPGTTRVLAAGDFDGDGRADLVVRTHRGGTRDTVAVYRGSAEDLLGRRPAMTFSSSEFLSG